LTYSPPTRNVRGCLNSTLKVVLKLVLRAALNAVLLLKFLNSLAKIRATVLKRWLWSGGSVSCVGQTGVSAESLVGMEIQLTQGGIGIGLRRGGMVLIKLNKS
jgi:hypothetical protein